MKLSKLRALCDKAIEKYGDLTVGAFSKDYAYDVEQESDMYDVVLRVLTTGGGLPGSPIEDEEPSEDNSSSSFACIFYKD
jgi:hypothetical protein